MFEFLKCTVCRKVSRRHSTSCLQHRSVESGDNCRHPLSGSKEVFTICDLNVYDQIIECDAHCFLTCYSFSWCSVCDRPSLISPMFSKEQFEAQCGRTLYVIYRHTVSLHLWSAAIFPLGACKLSLKGNKWGEDVSRMSQSDSVTLISPSVDC